MHIESVALYIEQGKGSHGRSIDFYSLGVEPAKFRAVNP